MGEVRVWFKGASAVRVIRADGCFVGPAGELKLYRGDEIAVIIAPGAWVFVDLPVGGTT